MANLAVRVIPNASKNEIVGWSNDANDDHVLKVRIKAIADKGRANKELISYLAKVLGIPKKNIVIASGQTSRLKRLQIADIKLSHGDIFW